jgi:hypothetical protein
MMRAMTEAEFMLEIGTGRNRAVFIDALVSFHRSHGHYEIARTIEYFELAQEGLGFADEDDCEPADEETTPADVSEGAGI